MALNAANIVRLERTVQPEIKPEVKTAPKVKNNKNETNSTTRINIANLVVGDRKVDAKEELTKGVKEVITMAEKKLTSADKLKSSYFWVQRESDYLSHNTKGNRR